MNELILIVDDNKENLKLVGNILRQNQYRIAMALDGQSALKIMGEEDFDLILLDIMMPVMDGIEVCRIIKADPKLASIPVIFLTAKNQPDDLIEGFNAGAVDYLVKPFNIREMLVRVNTHIELYQAKKRILTMSKNRDLMYSIIAHDIRSPFARIIQLIEAIEHQIITTDSQDFKEILHAVYMRSKDTFELIENLIEWEQKQLDNPQINLQQNDIYPLITETIEYLKPEAEAKNIQLVFNGENQIFALCDKQTIKTILRNLISNAIKFTGLYGSITLSIEETHTFLKLIISDNGIGMDADLVNKLTTGDEYVLSERSNSNSGHGLGLKIVKDFIKLNKAKMTIESKPGEGSVFTIVLLKN
ncbi:MAG TPA: hypothetical protein DCX89_02890 [Saprospirales bacterium]|nr:hypothetical protein [Saprospirales bacterium]HRQ29808.1 hybrid sensor histidine kinase/response regulator [Saprospiraceae bacterium]